MPTNKTNGRIVAFDGLRGFAACYVVLNHLQGFIQPHSWLGNKLAAFFFHHPSLGSRTLLLISGCVIYRAFLLRPVPVLSFWRQRISRIYFPYLVILAIYLVISILYPSKSKIPETAMEAIPMLAAGVILWLLSNATRREFGVEALVLAVAALFYFIRKTGGQL